MCGIFGALGRILPDSAIERVLEILDHRGPDSKGTFIDEATQLTIAHTRLAVIDLVTGDQPLKNEDGSIVLACNGEIYDFERIRSSLEGKDYRFKTKSDSEVILGLYQEYGLNCFEHLRGEFAFLLYDKAKRLLIASRDRFGIKPLYFSRFADGVVFASEMKAIFASGLVEPKINVLGLDPFLEPDPANIQFAFEAIEQVPPASFVIVDLDTGQSKVTRYWSLEIPDAIAEPLQNPAEDRAASYAKTIQEELEQAVKLRLRADVPVGLYLSGGIDSALVGALMKRNLNSPFHSFSISFTGSEGNEQKFTRQAAAFLGTVHHDLIVSKQMLWDNLEDTLWSTELPFATLAPIGKFLLSKEARKFVTVVLNGQGADEVFLGYRSFFRNAIGETRNAHGANAPTALRRRRLQLTRLSPWIVDKLSLLIFHKSQRDRLVMARAKARAASASARPLINRLQEARISEMPIDILGYLGDRVEMAHSLEVRVPFLDHKLYDAAKLIPNDLKMRGGIEKAVLRDAAKGILPEDIRTRPKRGFMLTSDSIDFFGTDRNDSARFRRRFSKGAFDRTGLFSWRTYLFVSFLARLPLTTRIRALKRLQRDANKVLMYILQGQLLDEMFVANPRWAKQALHQKSQSRGALDPTG